MNYNALIIAVLLTGLQGFILWVMNGEMKTLITNKELDVLALIMSPTGALVWTLKAFTGGRKE